MSANRHPDRLYFLSFVEMWERFGFHGMRALLVLYLATATSRGGFGWSDSEAIWLYCTYMGLVYVTPPLGGFVADRWLGRRRAVLLGAILLLTGHALMAGPGLAPWAMGAATGLPVERLLATSAVPLGHLGLPGGGAAQIADAARSLGLSPEMAGPAVEAAIGAYHLVSITFYGALAALIAGIGLFKPNTATLVGEAYTDTARREAGFTVFYFAINIGAFAAPLVAGGLGEFYGWHYGFGCAALGMLVSLAALMAGWRRYVGPADRAPTAVASDVSLAPLRRIDRDRLWALGLLGLVAIAYELAYGQSGALINLYTYETIDRRVLGVEIPASWFQSLGSMFLLLLSLPLTALWAWLAARGRNPGVVTKFTLSLVASATAFLAMLLTTEAVPGGASAALSGLVLFYFFLTLSELLMAPISYAAVSRLAPPRLAGAAMGGLYLTWSIGGWLAGVVGAYAVTREPERFFTAIAASLFLLALGLRLAAPWLRRLMHEPGTSRG